MRKEYNLRLVSRPSTAARRIQQRLRELSWRRHPKIREKEKIFVGRNDLIKLFEERFDDIAKVTPVGIICSGLKKIGRRAFLKYALTKTNVIDQSYDPLRIYLSQDDGIEGFIIKLYDLGVSSQYDLLNLLNKTTEEKTEIATSICREVADARDVLLIEDDGSIVGYEGQIAAWFLKIAADLNRNRLFFAIAAIFKPQRTFKHDQIFNFNIAELEPIERKGLLKRYSELEEMDLPRDDLEFVSGLLQGYPDEAFFAVDTIKRAGINFIRKNPSEIIEFSKNRAAVVLSRYEDDQELMDLLRFLSEFELVSYKLIDDVLKDDPVLKNLERFVMESICEETGSIGEYIRVNDVVRGYILRYLQELPDRYARLLRERTSIYIKNNPTIESGDASEYLYYIKSALADGQKIDERLLLPAHFLLSMREAYNRGRYGEVVRLCDRIAQRSNFLEERIRDDIQYFLCQSLARLRDPRFLKEVQLIRAPEHDFLLGFYYRLQGRYKDAVERQLKAAAPGRSERRARRELVQNYLLMEDFDRALDIARDNYKRFSTNPFMIQGYFSSLIQQQRSEGNRRELFELIEKYKSVPGERAREMEASARAFMASFYDNDQARAFDIIDDAISSFPTNKYPLLTKMDIAVRAGNKIALKECLACTRFG